MCVSVFVANSKSYYSFCNTLMWKITWILTYVRVEVKFFHRPYSLSKISALLKSLLNSGQNVGQIICCPANILKKTCLVVLVIYDVRIKTPITYITRFRNQLYPVFCNWFHEKGLKRLLCRKNMSPSIPIPRIYWRTCHGTRSTINA
jgi:hypothetical protein